MEFIPSRIQFNTFNIKFNIKFNVGSGSFRETTQLESWGMRYWKVPGRVLGSGI
jgi:hypothetical protein